MTFRVLESIKTKLVIVDQRVEQVNRFMYLGNDITYDKDRDIDNKLNKYQNTSGIPIRI